MDDVSGTQVVFKTEVLAEIMFRYRPQPECNQEEVYTFLDVNEYFGLGFLELHGRFTWQIHRSLPHR